MDDLQPTMRIALDIITLFPDMFASLTEQGVVGRAFKNELVDLKFWNPREFALNAYKTVDDRPYGGGPGMVMMAPPLAQSIRSATDRQTALGFRAHVIYMSPQGGALTQHWVSQKLSQMLPKHHEAVGENMPEATNSNPMGLVFVCGRYEAIDERLFDLGLIHEELSVGDVVVSGGELPAMLTLDALLRCVDGVLNDEQSAQQDSFSDGLLDCPHYTRPEIFEGLPVPDVLLSGNHAKIAVFRREQQLRQTLKKRPDLVEAARQNGELSKADEKILARIDLE